MSSWVFTSPTVGAAGEGTSGALDVAFLALVLALLLASRASWMQRVILWTPQLPVVKWGTRVSRRTV